MDFCKWGASAAIGRSRRPVGHFITFCLIVGFWLVLNSASAVTSRNYTGFQYDESGNLISIESEVSNQPPQISSITPAIIRIGPAVAMTVVGTDLRGVTVTPDNSDILIQNVTSSSTEVGFNLVATNATTLGVHQLTFSTPLGDATASITVQPRLPVLFVSPSPLATSVNSGATALDIRLSSADIADHTISFSVTNTNIATISPTSITIPAGSTVASVSVEVQPLSIGNSGVLISSATLGNSSVPVFVTEPFIAPIGENAFFSSILGVTLTPAPEPPELLPRGPIISELAVVNPVAEEPDTSNIGPVASTPLGINIGNALLSISPKSIGMGGGVQVLTLAGTGLDAVTEVNISPADGISIGAYAPATDGKSATLAISVVEGALTGLRQLTLAIAGEAIPAVSPESDRFLITDVIPEIISIDPIVVVRGTTSVLVTVRGRQLHDVEALNITPASGMISATPQVNAEGTMVTARISIPEDVPLGPRLVSVTTPAGSSASTLSAANTLTIVNAPGQDITPLSSLALGVVKEDNQSSPSVTLGPITSNTLGVAFGAVVTGLSPSSQPIGASFTLTLSGQGFEAGDTVSFQPNTGLEAGAATIAADGKDITLPVSIAADAPQLVRSVQVLRNGLPLPASSASASQFLVTGLIPVLESVSPLHIVIGASPAQLSLRGRFFDDAQQVRILPAEGISTSAPAVSADGTSLVVNVSAVAGSAAGTRMLVVDTPAGSSSSVSTSANSVMLVNQVLNVVTPITANNLGVVIEEQPPTTPTVDRDAVSDLLGVVIEQAVTPATRPLDARTPILGVAKGSFARQVQPSAAAIGSSLDLNVTGEGLDLVTGVSFVPPEGITQTAAFTISPDGKLLTLPITVAVDAAITSRAVVLATASGNLVFSEASANQFRLSDGTPEVISISPIQELQGQTLNLLVRGVSLENAIAVTATPSTGISFSTNPVSNAAGTEVTVQMNLASDAPIGPRLITVVTPGGNTSADLSPANTFTVLGGSP
ncbi:hypothetical protein [Sulfuriflexus mobilis]|uniref:hypothetical protein n=1 Tax=Sulfuriflexus mobilis TaxID=1811807 RepID=UPI000F819B97|nr:hypothetical protein [Sulfuriflexus mobilis]